MHQPLKGANVIPFHLAHELAPNSEIEVRCKNLAGGSVSNGDHRVGGVRMFMREKPTREQLRPATVWSCGGLKPRARRIHWLRLDYSVVMKLGYQYFRNSLIKLTILSMALPFILWGFFTGREKGSFFIEALCRA